MATIIFDFDGTIADSFEYVADFLAAEAGQASLTADQQQALHGQSMIAMARQLGNPWWRLPGLLLKGRRQMGQAMTQVEPFDGIPEVIKKVHAEGHELFIVSSNTVANVHKFLHHHQLHKYFLEVYGSVGLFGKGRALRRLLKEHHLEQETALYIGDELRDVRAAYSAKMRVIAVTWGFARPADLEAQRPTALAHQPEDLLRILEEL